MTKEMTKKGNTNMTISDGPQHSEVLQGDILIGKVLLMQGLSELVMDRKAQLGDMVHNLTHQKLGDPEHPLEFIPLTLKNTWVNFEEINGKFEFRGSEPRTAKNEDAPWEYEQNGVKCKRTKRIDCYCLLPADIEAEVKEIERVKKTGELPDVNKVLLPIAIGFQVTSFKAGRALATHFAKVQTMAKYGAKPFSHIMNLSCFADKNDKGNFFVLDVKPSRTTPKEYLEKCSEWYQVVNTQKVVVDETEPTNVDSSIDF